MEIYGLKVQIDEEGVRIENLNGRVYYSARTQESLEETLTGILRPDFVKKAVRKILKSGGYGNGK